MLTPPSPAPGTGFGRLEAWFWSVVAIPTVTVPLDTLVQFCHETAERMGVPAGDDEILVDVLVSGSLRSLPGQGQGVQQLPVYYERIRTGVVDVRAPFEISARHGAVSLADAHRGLGSVAATKAMKLAVELAAEHGIGAVGVHDSTHFGIAAYYAMLALPHDFIGLAFSNAGPEIAPWGGTQAVVGTNPWAVAVPAGAEWPVVLDLANSTSGKGMIGWHGREGLPIPDDWALTAAGERTTDPELGAAGTLFPLGGAKGYGMAVVVDALTGVLTGSAFGLACFGAEWQNVGHLLVALDVSRFGPVADFKQRMDALIAQIRSSPLAPGADAIYLPGELEFHRERERRRDGVPIEAGRFDALAALGRELGVPTALDLVAV
jgi:LDH2 family malate/lactate/ureidoglycolate dehydrogenase